MAGIDTLTALPTAALVGLLLLSATAAPAVAATDTPVRLVGPDGPATVGETATVSVVVGETEGGVGAYNLTVATDDPDVAAVVDAEVAGDPGIRDVEVAPDGSRVTVRAALMDTADAGEVTVATVTVAAEAAGETDLTVAVETLGDETGRPYEVTTEAGSTLTVDGDTESTGESTGTTPSDESGGTASESADTDENGTEDGSAADAESTETTSSDESGGTASESADTDENGTEDGSAADAESTGTTPSDEQSSGTASESDAGDEDWVVPTEARESLSLFSPAATGFALFAVAALTGGIVYRRRLR